MLARRLLFTNVFTIILSVGAIAALLSRGSGQEEQFSNIDRAWDALQKEDYFRKRKTDYRWLLDVTPEDRKIDTIAYLCDRLAKCKVNGRDAVGSAVFRYKREHGELKEVNSTHGNAATVTGLVRLARDVPEFGEKGDFVWVVQIYHDFGGGKGEAPGGMLQELWIVAETGRIRPVFSY